MLHNNTVYVTEEIPTWDFFDSLMLVTTTVVASAGTVVWLAMLASL